MTPSPQYGLATSFRGRDFIWKPTAATFGELYKRENLVYLPNICIENNIPKHLHIFCLTFVLNLNAHYPRALFCHHMEMANI